MFLLRRLGNLQTFNTFYRNFSHQNLASYSMETESQYDYDFVVIGGGSGGLRAAKTASKLGVKVAVIDYVVPSPLGTKWGLGGTCVNVGCVPKKLFHYAALMGESMHSFENAGWKADKSQQHSWETMVAKVDAHIHQLNWNSKLVLTEKGIKYFNLRAKFVDPHTLELHDPKKDKKQTITAKNIMIAVGGRPNYPDEKQFPLAKKLVLTSDDIFYYKKYPGKSLVIGGSYIALETAGFLQSFGCDVTLLVRSTILRQYDQEMAAKVGKYMENMGTKFLYGAKMEKLEEAADGKKKVTYKDKDGNVHEDTYDTIFVAIGRTAETQYLNLDAIGIKVDEESKKVITNDHDQTNIPHIYSLGDCALDRPELTPPAVHAGQLLANRLFGNSKELMDYDRIATTFFTPLEYSVIGYSEKKACEKFGKDNISAYHSTFKPLEWAFDDDKPGDACYVKMVCKKDENEKVIGLHYVGPNAGEVMQGFSLGINMGATRHDFFRTIGIHPTSAEEVLNPDVPTDQDCNAQEGCKGCGL